MTPNRRPDRLFFLAVIGALGIAGCSNGNSPTSPGNPPGARFHLGPFAVGQSASFAFPAAGTFPYHCIAHQNMGMTGTVRVDSTGADSALVRMDANGFAFVPNATHIRPGGLVRWVNASSLTNHTVTSD